MTYSETSFPSVKPALVIKVYIDGKYPVGDIYTGSNLVTVPFSSGFVRSVDGFEPKVDLQVVNGVDWFYIDADKGHARVNVKAIAKDDQDVFVGVALNGVLTLNETVMPFLLGDPNAKSSPFGHGVETVTFETGDAKYKFLESNLWTASVRFLIEEGRPAVELRVAKIISGTGEE